MNERVDVSHKPKLRTNSHGMPYSGTYCPKCLSSDIAQTPAEVCNAVGNLTQGCTCRECKYVWVNVFSLSYFVELLPEDIP